MRGLSQNTTTIEHMMNKKKIKKLMKKVMKIVKIVGAVLAIILAVYFGLGPLAGNLLR